MSRALRYSSTAPMRCCSSSAVMVVLCIRSGPAMGRGARAGMAVQGMLANLLPDRVRQQVAWRAPRRDQGAQVSVGDGQLGDTQHGDAATGSAVELVRRPAMELQPLRPRAGLGLHSGGTLHYHRVGPLHQT